MVLPQSDDKRRTRNLHSLTSSGSLRRLVSDRVGLIRDVCVLEKGMEEPSIPFLYRALLGNITGCSEMWAGVGKGKTKEEALVAAIAEALERYCALCPDDTRIKCLSLKEIGDAAIDPESFVLYSSAQYNSPEFPYHKYRPDSPIAWHEAIELPHETCCYVPASMVYLRPSAKSRGDRLTAATSSGLAAGRDLPSALLGGILELVERESLLITWMHQLPVDQLDTSDLGLPEANIVVEHYRRFGIDTQVYILPTDIPVNSIMAVAKDQRARPPAVAIGLGCSLSPAGALRKAIFELCQVRHGETWRFWNTDTKDRLETPENIRRTTDHSGYYSVRERANAFAFLEQAKVRSIRNLVSHETGNLWVDVGRCVDTLRTLGCRVIYVDITTPDLIEFEIRVVRVMITELQPIHFGYRHERLGGNRLYTLPKKLGFFSERKNDENFSPFPHPLG